MDRYSEDSSASRPAQVPPINRSTKPQGFVPREPLIPYWQASFGHDLPVHQFWKQELGDNGWGNNELQNYTSSNLNSFHRVTGDSSSLVIRARAENNTFTSARLTSRATLGRRQGYLSARITAPSAKGVWPAFWLLPQEPFSWPEDGEVDIMESWNNLRTNHSCLHWGHYNGEDYDKHRVLETPVPTLDHPNGLQYGLAWDMASEKLMWYINDMAVMQADIPRGTRSIDQFQIKLNVAMGGTVNEGQRPADGTYEMIIHEIGMFEAPPYGWDHFHRFVQQTPQGHTM